MTAEAQLDPRPEAHYEKHDAAPTSNEWPAIAEEVSTSLLISTKFAFAAFTTPAVVDAIISAPASSADHVSICFDFSDWASYALSCST